MKGHLCFGKGVVSGYEKKEDDEEGRKNQNHSTYTCNTLNSIHSFILPLVNVMSCRIISRVAFFTGM